MNLTVMCKTTEVIKRLTENRERHSALVQEARDGYIKAAKAELEKRLEKLRSGVLVSVAVQLVTPQDHTADYDMALKMLQSHTEEDIVLQSDDYRQLMEDKWDWWRGFVGSNSRYSSSTRALVEDE